MIALLHVRGKEKDDGRQGMRLSIYRQGGNAQVAFFLIMPLLASLDDVVITMSLCVFLLTLVYKIIK